jgi:hypothetical protein
MDCFNWQYNDQVIGSCLTIRDIEAVSEGETLDCLLLHRNAYDVPSTIHPFNTPMNPTEFFRSRVTFTKTGDMKGILHEEDERSHEDVAMLHVEYAPHQWYPLDNGYLPESDEQGLFPLLGRRTHWSEFPKTTRVGFRGPMIPWDKAANLPDVYNPVYPPTWWSRLYGTIQRFRMWIRWW